MSWLQSRSRYSTMGCQDLELKAEYDMFDGITLQMAGSLLSVDPPPLWLWLVDI